MLEQINIAILVNSQAFEVENVEIYINHCGNVHKPECHHEEYEDQKNVFGYFVIL
jgi:hypothetical protein